jgi:hypothetical protein
MSSPEDDLLSYDNLKAFAWSAGFHAEIHRNFDKALQRPGRERACWYLQPGVKQFGGERKSILTYALPSEIYDWIVAYQKTEYPNGA